VNNSTFILTIVLIICSLDWCHGQSNHVLWYGQPAQYFEESLVLGNGKMGASVFGGVLSDQIYLNDAKLWSGGPVDANMNPEAYKNIPAIREALKNENYKLADELNKKVQGRFSESYAPLGTLFLEFKHEGKPTNYYRALDISQAISKVTYEVDGVKFSREYFISYPDQMMAIKLTSSQKGALNFGVRFESQLRDSVFAAGNVLKIRGYAPAHAEPSYRSSKPDAVKFDENKGTRFSTLVKIKSKDGKITSNDQLLSLSGGTEALVFVSIATSFNGFDKDPVTQGLIADLLAENQLKAAFSK